MVLGKAVDGLKDKSDDEKKVVAGGIAVAVVAVLFLGWAILFLKKIQREGDVGQLGGGAQDEFIGTSVRQAQEELMEGFSDIDELRAVREEAGRQYQQGSFQQEFQQTEADPFGGSGAIE